MLELAYSEIMLKSRSVRSLMERQLRQNASGRFKILAMGGGILLAEGDPRSARTLFGIDRIRSGESLPLDLDDIFNSSKKLFSGKEKTFAVRVIRSGNHDFTSMEFAAELGGLLKEETRLSVDLDSPDKEIFVRIRGKNAFVSGSSEEGPGGLPVGASGEAFLEISSSEDLLFAWLYLRRGVRIHYYGKKDKALSSWGAVHFEKSDLPISPLLGKKENTSLYPLHAFTEKDKSIFLEKILSCEIPDFSTFCISPRNSTE